jgi:very-short-patch-repair endonuclease
MREVWCALLAVGPTAVVTDQTALHLHGVHRVSRRPITLTVPHGGHARLDRVFVHQIDDLGRHLHRVATLSGLPVSTPERAVVESAAWLGEKHLGSVLDDLLDARTTTLPRVAACFREVVRPGKPGMDKVGRVLDERRGGYVPRQSELERALLMVLAAGGLPEPRRQFGLPGRGAIEGVVDGAYPEARTILDVDGRAWHARIAAFKHDRLRDLEAARAGWLTVRLVYEQVVHEPSEVCAAVRDVLASRGLPCEPRPLPEAIGLKSPRARRDGTYRLG